MEELKVRHGKCLKSTLTSDLEVLATFVRRSIIQRRDSFPRPAIC